MESKEKKKRTKKTKPNGKTLNVAFVCFLPFLRFDTIGIAQSRMQKHFQIEITRHGIESKIESIIIHSIISIFALKINQP